MDGCIAAINPSICEIYNVIGNLYFDDFCSDLYDIYIKPNDSMIQALKENNQYFIKYSIYMNFYFLFKLKVPQIQKVSLN